MSQNKSKRHRIPLSDREIAAKLLMRLANHPDEHDCFCLSWVYDYDVNFLIELAKDLGITEFPSKSYIRRLRRVCRKLELGGILYGRVRSCQAVYLGEPRTLKSYQFADPSYACRLSPERHPHYKPMGKVETELDFLLDRCGFEEAKL